MKLRCAVGVGVPSGAEGMLCRGHMLKIQQPSPPAQVENLQEEIDKGVQMTQPKLVDNSIFAIASPVSRKPATPIRPHLEVNHVRAAHLRRP
ncbi:MAG: hypothetical protein R6W79_01370 [Acidimicrobiia bacterium]